MIRPDYRPNKYTPPLVDLELLHYGMPRRSGRYPWGSGERPYQSQTIGGYIAKGVKSGYDKIPQGVKTAAKIGGKVAASVAISNALGVVGGMLVYEAIAPRAANIKGWSNILETAMQVDKARNLGKATYAGIATTLSLGSIGKIRVPENTNKDKKKDK